MPARGREARSGRTRAALERSRAAAWPALTPGAVVAARPEVTEPGFELELLGGPVERRYRARACPELEQLPWTSIRVQDYDPDMIASARRSWTRLVMSEYAAALACSAVSRALMEARAPLDLSALAAGFVEEELVHVELCARMAMALGGAERVIARPERLIADAEASLSPLLRALDLVVRYFCVAESLSFHVARHIARQPTVPLVRGVLARVLRDEARHASFGGWVLDWADDQLDADARAHLARAASKSIASLLPGDAPVEVRASLLDPSAWTRSREGLEFVAETLTSRIPSALRERGIAVELASRCDAPATI